MLTEEKGYVGSVDELRFFAYAGGCIAKIREMGYYSIVITNQSGIARGLDMDSLISFFKKKYNIAHTAIYEYILKHPFFDAVSAVLKNANEKDFCRTVAGRNDLALTCCSYGELNKNRNIYFIHYGNKTRGFFAEMRMLLKYFAYADRFGFAPVVLWDSSFPYAEEKEIQGTKNPFEYYFVQPSGISLEEMYQSYNVFEAKEVHVTKSFLNREIRDGESGYWMSEKYMERLSGYVKKYIHLNSFTEKYMNEHIVQLIGNKKTIGVHVRGTDYNNHYNNHPIGVSIEEYFKAVDELLQNNEYDQIFLATDDLRVLQQFIDKYSSKLLYYTDVIRTDINQSVAFSINERKNHKYLLGLEVLRDMYTLTACDALVAGISQVSLMARVFKKSTVCDYRQKIILENGYYKNNNIFVK